MSRILIFAVAATLIWTVAGQAAAAQSADSLLYALFEADETERRENPDALVLAGSEEVEKTAFRDVTPEATVRRLRRDEDLLRRLHSISPDDLAGESMLNYQLFEHVLIGRIAEGKRRTWRIPFLSDAGFHIGLSSSVEGTAMNNAEDIESYLRKLSGIPAYIDQQIANMRVGLAEGYTQPRAIMAKIEPSFEALKASSAEESVFSIPFDRLPESLNATDVEAYRTKGKIIIEGDVLPALDRLYAFIHDEYTPNARTTLGASELPDGQAYYQSLIENFTTLDLTADDIHQVGLSEAARIRSEMEDIIEEVEFVGSFSEFLHFLRTDPQFYVDTPTELLMHAAWIAKRIDEKMPAFFNDMPKMPYGVRAVPDEIAPNYTTGRYWGAIKDVRGGLFMVNTYNLPERPLYNLPALALHEGVPGHHHQIALTAEMEDVPAFRRGFYLSAFGEGWGLYCERLGLEMGIYQTPYERFGRLTYEMWRAGRLVVDTGIHAMGWSRDQAIAFFMENSALAEHNINTEVDRYISWPGQALSYKMGELKIVELRERAETTLGERFDVRDFHDAILSNGTVPLSIMEDQVDAYIDRVSTSDEATTR